MPPLSRRDLLDLPSDAETAAAAAAVVVVVVVEVVAVEAVGAAASSARLLRLEIATEAVSTPSIFFTFFAPPLIEASAANLEPFSSAQRA
jgi:hypothetical protein